MRLRTHRTVAAIELIVGLGALYGGFGLLTDPEGMGAKQSWLDGSVFPDFTIPGLFLLVVIGGGMLVAAAATWFASRYAAAAARHDGRRCWLLWGLVETVTLGWLGGAQFVLLTAFVVVPGITLTVTGGRALRSTAGDDGSYPMTAAPACASTRSHSSSMRHA